MAGKLSGRTILVTGASQGIGAEVAKHCAAEGATVILVARRQKRMEKVYDEIVAAGSPEPFAVCFDLLTAEENEFAQLAATIGEATGGRLDGIVHCASCFTALSPLEFQTVGDWVKQYRINTVGPMGLTRAFTPLLKQSDDASVLFVSGKLAAAGKNPPRRIEKRTARTGRHHARLHLLAGQRKQRQKRRNGLFVAC